MGISEARNGIPSSPIGTSDFGTAISGRVFLVHLII
jgi:hypothetical protein